MGKLIVAKGLKKLPKVQLIAQSGHTDSRKARGVVNSQAAFVSKIRCIK